MKNYYIENKEVILSLNEHKIDGCADGKATLDVLCDVFDTNIDNFDVEGAAWYECSKSRDDKEYWCALREAKADASNERIKLQHEWVKSFK